MLPKSTEKRVLIVTAHPDDESMFFGPTIMHLHHKYSCTIYILCLSPGNFNHLGNMRRYELWMAASVLSIPPENVMLLKADTLPDGIEYHWDAGIVGRHICDFVDRYDIDMLVTFDQNGVSGHPNHCAIYYAVAGLLICNGLPHELKVFTLDTVNVARKYLLMLDILLSWMRSAAWCFVLDWSDYARVRWAMQKHVSQMVWFRWIYIALSRYMIINTLTELTVEQVKERGA